MDRSQVESLHVLLEELERARTAITELLAQRPTAPVVVAADAPTEVRELAQLLDGIRSTLVANPAATNRVVKWLVHEGRRFAETEVGADWQRRLAATHELEHLYEVWEATSMGVFDDIDDDGVVPAAWIDLVHDLVVSHRSTDLVSEALSPPGTT